MKSFTPHEDKTYLTSIITSDKESPTVTGNEGLETTTQSIANASISNNDYDPFDDFDLSKIIQLPAELSDDDLSDYLPQNPNVPDPGDLGDPVDLEIPVSGDDVNDVSIFTHFEGDTIDPDTDLDPIGGLEVKEAPPTGVYESGEMADFETTPLPEDGIFRTEIWPLEVSGQDSGPIVSDEVADFETTPLPEDGIFRTEGGLLEVYSQSTGSIESGELEVVGTMPSFPAETGELLI
ncbi:hypothetical protein BFW38_03670 [Terasakiispira papahanaumokuakeensis]|uniref:Uncharacterized protein n=2 Tax=Terasakiispira papahanaumokuakeensis TaxID=197479 RepID=A0A1E2V7Z5_9GAMM|nr:hypothetical protein BFW38_03670 [Terasakiispira papahanaumokuakeensis]